MVIKIDRENDVVTTKDFNGNTWQFEGVEDWQVNDICGFVMDTNRTETIYDDVILSKTYNGYKN